MNSSNGGGAFGAPESASPATRRRQPRRGKDQDGRSVVWVPLANVSEEAVIEAKDFDDLTDRGLSDQWCFNGGRGGKGYARVNTDLFSSRRLESVHRLIMGAGPTQTVLFINGNTLDLRRSNLRMVRRAQQVHEYLERQEQLSRN